MDSYNFTDRVRKVTSLARDYATERRDEYVGTEHLLVAMVREGEGVAMAVLQRLGVDTESIEQTVESLLTPGKATEQTGPDLPYTSRAKRSLGLAIEESRDFQHSYVSTEHLLLGLIREETGVAAQALAKAGLTADAVRAETLQILGPRPDVK